MGIFDFFANEKSNSRFTIDCFNYLCFSEFAKIINKSEAYQKCLPHFTPGVIPSGNELRFWSQKNIEGLSIIEHGNNILNAWISIRRKNNEYFYLCNTVPGFKQLEKKANKKNMSFSGGFALNQIVDANRCVSPHFETMVNEHIKKQSPDIEVLTLQIFGFVFHIINKQGGMSFFETLMNDMNKK